MGLNIFGIVVGEPLKDTKEALIHAVPDEFKCLLTHTLDNGFEPETFYHFLKGSLEPLLNPVKNFINAYQRRFFRSEQFQELKNQKSILELENEADRQELRSQQLLTKEANRLFIREKSPFLIFQFLLSEGTLVTLKDRIIARSLFLLYESSALEVLIENFYETEPNIVNNDKIYDDYIQEHLMKLPLSSSALPPPGPPPIITRNCLTLKPSQKQQITDSTFIARMRHTKGEQIDELAKTKPDFLRRFVLHKESNRLYPEFREYFLKKQVLLSLNVDLFEDATDRPERLRFTSQVK